MPQTQLVKLEQANADVTRDVAAIFVAIPPDEAAAACTWALGRGAHVFCEKPLGLSAEQARSVQDVAVAHRARLGAGFNYRYLPGVTFLKEAIVSGRIGEVYSLRMYLGHGGRPGMEREWKLSAARAGGGALIDPGIHLVDLARFLFGSATATHELHRGAVVFGASMSKTRATPCLLAAMSR